MALESYDTVGRYREMENGRPIRTDDELAAMAAKVREVVWPVVLEDVGVEWGQGILDQLAGFIFGQCTHCGPSGGYGSLTLEEVLRDHIQPLGIPAWSNAAIGHVEPILTIPLGVEVAIDADRGRITMLSPAIAAA